MPKEYPLPPQPGTGDLFQLVTFVLTQWYRVLYWLVDTVGSGSGGPVLETNGVLNGSQTLLNLKQGSNITITDDGIGDVTIAATATPLLLETNGVANGSQALLNLKNGTNITIADDGVGGVTITGAAGGVTNVTATSPLASSGGATPDISVSVKHGNSARIQYSDNTGASGNITKFDANENVTDGGASAANLVLDGFGITVGDGASSPSTGSKGYRQVPYACTITGWTILMDVPGACQFTVKKSTYAGFPTTASIVAGAPPLVAATNRKNTSTTLTGWTTAITAGDVLEFNLDSVATATRIFLILNVTRT